LRESIGYSYEKVFNTFSPKIGNELLKDRFIDSIDVIQKIVKEIPVLIYVGNFDIMDGPGGQ